MMFFESHCRKVLHIEESYLLCLGCHPGRSRISETLDPSERKEETWKMRGKDRRVGLIASNA